MKKSIIAALYAAALVLSCGGAVTGARAQGPSFNCGMASKPDEVLICQSPELSALDRNMSGLYFTIRNRLAGPARAQLDADQTAWLNSRYACGRDFGCVAAAYRQRIA
jgi:uncharacterized protein